MLYRHDPSIEFTALLKFYVVRMRRLLPLLFSFIAILALVEQHKPWLFVKSSVLMLTGLNNLIPAEWMPRRGRDLRQPLWSIGVEIIFSAMLPFLAVAMKRVGFWRAFWVVIVLCFLYRIAPT